MKIHKGKPSMMIGILSGAGCSLLFSLVLAIAISSLVLNESIKESAASIAIIISIGISAFVGAFVAGIVSGKKKLIASLLSGGLYLLCLAGCNALLYGGALEGPMPVILSVALGAALAGVFPFVASGSGSKQIKKYRFG